MLETVHKRVYYKTRIKVRMYDLEFNRAEVRLPDGVTLQVSFLRGVVYITGSSQAIMPTEVKIILEVAGEFFRDHLKSSKATKPGQLVLFV